MSYPQELIDQAISLRIVGTSFDDIVRILDVKIPKSTLSFWFRNLYLPKDATDKIKMRNLDLLKKARAQSVVKRKNDRNLYFDQLFQKNKYLNPMMKSSNIAKIALALLYLGEGGKNPKRGSVQFGNSDPKVIVLFFKLMYQCYEIDDRKFRCTVQCRWGQDQDVLTSFWSGVSGVPLSQFYSTRVDPRTINRPMEKPDYKGVCRIDYLSASVFHDILSVIKVLTGP